MHAATGWRGPFPTAFRTHAPWPRLTRRHGAARHARHALDHHRGHFRRLSTKRFLDVLDDKQGADVAGHRVVPATSESGRWGGGGGGRGEARPACPCTRVLLPGMHRKRRIERHVCASAPPRAISGTKHKQPPKSRHARAERDDADALGLGCLVLLAQQGLHPERLACAQRRRKSVMSSGAGEARLLLDPQSGTSPRSMLSSRPEARARAGFPAPPRTPCHKQQGRDAIPPSQTPSPAHP